MTEPALPPQYQQVPSYIEAHIAEPRMQAIVTVGVVGGFGAMWAIGRGIAGAKTEEERAALKNVGKLAVGAAVVYILFRAFDIDRRWIDIESASKLIDQKMGWGK